MPDGFKTEFGVFEASFVTDTFDGYTPVKHRETADTIVANMTKAGHEARVVWRAISEWQDADDE